jgi:hypothetical protein
MALRARQVDVSQAADDLRSRTLSHLPRSLDRLIYLASTRDYNTGVYYHDGLAAMYSQDVACQALADCHREAFRQVVRVSLRDLVGQMESYMKSVQVGTDTIIAGWKKLEPYRVTVPVESDPLAAEFLFANFRTALAILESRQAARPASVPAA